MVERHVALFATLALLDQHAAFALGELQVAHAQPHQFAQAQAGMQQEQDQRSIPPAGDLAFGISFLGHGQVIFDGAKQVILLLSCPATWDRVVQWARS